MGWTYRAPETNPTGEETSRHVGKPLQRELRRFLGAHEITVLYKRQDQHRVCELRIGAPKNPIDHLDLGLAVDRHGIRIGEEMECDAGSLRVKRHRMLRVGDGLRRAPSWSID